MMVVAALLIAVLALLAVLVVALGLIELAAAGPSTTKSDEDANPRPLDLAPDAVGTDIASLGIEVPRDSAHLLLVVSPTCNGCNHLVDSFKGVFPTEVTFVVAAAPEKVLETWAIEKGLSTVVIDRDRAISTQLGIDGSPTAVGLMQGVVAFGAAVPGRAALDNLLRQLPNAQTGFVEKYVDKLAQ